MPVSSGFLMEKMERKKRYGVRRRVSNYIARYDGKITLNVVARRLWWTEEFLLNPLMKVARTCSYAGNRLHHRNRLILHSRLSTCHPSVSSQFTPRPSTSSPASRRKFEYHRMMIYFHSTRRCRRTGRKLPSLQRHTFSTKPCRMRWWKKLVETTLVRWMGEEVVAAAPFRWYLRIRSSRRARNVTQSRNNARDTGDKVE